MRIAWGVILLFGARFAVQSWFDARNNADIWWQQWLGERILELGRLPFSLGNETFTASGAPWVPQEWALSVAIALATRFHAFWVLALVATICGVLTLAVTGWTARRLGASELARGLCVLCVGFAMVESYGVRAQVFAWTLLAVCFYILRTVPGNGKFWIVPLTAIWANLHASAMLAPALTGLWTAGVLIEEKRWNTRVDSAFVLTLATAGAVLLTPLGLRLPLYALMLFSSPIRSGIVEWQPADLTSDSFNYGLLPLLVGACLLGIGRRRELPLFIAATWLALGAVRNIPVCAILIAPVIAARLTAYLPESLRINQLVRERSVMTMAYACFVIFTGLITVNLAHLAHFQAGRLPQNAMRAAAAQPGIHRLYCEDWAWCSLALSHPNMRIFMDGRCDPFPLAVWRETAILNNTRRQWLTVVAKNDIDQMLVKRGSRLERALGSRADWRIVYADGRFKVFSRESVRGAAYQ